MEEKTPTTDEWLEATATRTLDLGEMDILVKEREALWQVYEDKRKIATDAMKQAELCDEKILAALKDAGKSKYFVDGLGTISISSKSMVRVPAAIEAKKAFFKHLRELGEEVLFSMATVNSNTLNSWYSEKLDQALEHGISGFSVPGIEQPTMRESLRFTKDRKNHE